MNKPNKYGYYDIDSYLKTEYKIKEIEKFIIKLIKKKNDKSYNLLDIGCGNGNFINFLKKIFTNWNFTGIEYDKKLFNVCKNRLGKHKNIKFINVDIMRTFKDKKKYDIVILNGVLGVFDEILAKKLIYKILDLTNNKGEIFIISQFNNFGVDVLPKFRIYNSKSASPWCGGWNIYSKKTIQNWLTGKHVSYKFYKWKMPFKIKKNIDPIKSWTIKNDKNEQILTNGIGLLINLEILKIKNTKKLR